MATPNRISISMPPEFLEEVKAFAAREGCTLSELATRALRNYPAMRDSYKLDKPPATIEP